MRKQLRKAVKEKFQKIAVVCGAWHVPPLKNYLHYKTTADNALLRGIKKTRTKATWIPWSYQRLSRQSGYGAGVVSPAWYELLFGKRGEVIIRWMTKAARLLRREDLEGSPANIIEAVRLATTLTNLRGLAIAGMEELREAAVTVFGGGDPIALKLIEQQLIIGHELGKVPPEIPVVPLQKDVEQQIKSARLSKERKSPERLTRTLDLRKNTNLLASRLLHRLLLLNIPWGKQLKGSRHKTGSFSETWKLEWKPDFVLRIIEAGMWGNTVHSAATQRVVEKATVTRDLSEVAELINTGLNAALNDAVPILLKKLQNLSVLTHDPLQLMEALPPLVNIVRYGDTRQTDAQLVEQVIGQLFPRLTLGLPGACQHVDEEVSTQIFSTIQTVNRVVGILNHPVHQQQWERALQTLLITPQVDELIIGGSTRLLFDREIMAVTRVATKMHYALSKNREPARAIRWLEGFLFGNGLLLVYQPQLWKLIDNWLLRLSDTNFREMLPLLRRAFARYSVSERRKLLELAKREGVVATTDKPGGEILNNKNVESVLPTLQLLLGLKREN